MEWYPLELTASRKTMVFAGHAIARRLGRRGLPDWAIAETWEVSDVDDEVGIVVGGPLTGRSLRDLVQDEPEGLMGAGWHGPRFPLLTKFIDADGTLPVHLHGDDAAARRFEGEPNGKTEAWHILDAAPGATALVGVREGVSRDELHRALLDQDFDRVMRRLPVRTGQTIYVPGGTLHSFGPDTLIYEIEQTSNIQQHAMRWELDGSPIDEETWHGNIEALLEQWRPDPRPEFVPGLRIPLGDGVDRTFLCASPYFALERWTAGTVAPLRHEFATAQILSNVGQPVRVRSGSWSGTVGRARTLLLPAALGEVEIEGPADVLLGSLPDLYRDVVGPLRAAGYADDVIATLGEGVLSGDAPGRVVDGADADRSSHGTATDPPPGDAGTEPSPGGGTEQGPTGAAEQSPRPSPPPGPSELPGGAA